MLRATLHTCCAAALCAVATLPAWAGGEATDRREFKQSTRYPFIFQAEGYLSTTPPAPMRFEVRTPDCGHRDAPPLPPPPKKAPPTPPAVEPTNAVPPAYPPPASGPQTAANGSGVDFSKVPDEVLEFFRQSDGTEARRVYLFDPIFQPVRPNDLPKSKATYTQTP